MKQYVLENGDSDGDDTTEVVTQLPVGESYGSIWNRYFFQQHLIESGSESDEETGVWKPVISLQTLNAVDKKCKTKEVIDNTESDLELSAEETNWIMNHSFNNSCNSTSISCSSKSLIMDGDWTLSGSCSSMVGNSNTEGYRDSCDNSGQTNKASELILSEEEIEWMMPNYVRDDRLQTQIEQFREQKTDLPLENSEKP